jgi:aspartyl-tRNA(Asn)/glutamyl-tRNA(Gln) amidotransferase subunit B
MNNNWQTVIGIEIHAQVNSKSKLFSSSSTEFGSAPNTQVSLVDAAMPGMLPVINKFCIEQAIKSGLGLNATINNKSIFDRKNYFYQDLPQGYQISQFKDPIVGEGAVEIDIDGKKKIIGIERLHLEQDAGKSLHDQDPNMTFVDLNRSGIALMEIVSKPDMASPEEAIAYVRKVRTILRYLDTCDGNMEQGSLRADVNISVRKEGDELGTRCEIKNLNSFKHIGLAINFEVDRQIKVIENGDKVKQETRLYDVSTDKTRSMRSKEDAHDYRYFPDPDLLPLNLNQNWIDEIKKTLPELPDTKKTRFINDYKISEYDADVLTQDKSISEYFEDVATNRSIKLSVSWVASELFAVLNKLNLTY